MCGIVGAVAERNVAPLLLNSLKLLEFRGYDAANIVVINPHHKLERHETLNKVLALEKLLTIDPLPGIIGIANTNWSGHNDKKKDLVIRIADDKLTLVQNGLIENSEKLRARLIAEGYVLNTETDTELVGYLIYHYQKKGQDLLTAIRSAERDLEGAFAVICMHSSEPGHLHALRRGSTLVIGLGVDENFIASDHTALLEVAEQFIYLEEGDMADITRKEIAIYDKNGLPAERSIFIAETNKKSARKGKYTHLMLKEIYDQPDAISFTLQGRINSQQVFIEAFGTHAPKFFSRIHRVHIVASDTSFHAGLVGRYWIEAIAGIPCQVEPAGESVYRPRIIEPNTLFVTLSQSGETVTTLNALRIAKKLGYTATLTIGNAPESSLVSESDLALITGEGILTNETAMKDFTAQLTALSLLALSLGRYHQLNPNQEAILAKKLRNLPTKAQQALQLDSIIKSIAPELTHQRALFLSNGIQLPVAMEGAMKLKQTSSTYADTYLAEEYHQYQSELADPTIPILALAPSASFLDVVLSKIQDRGSKLIIFTDEKQEIKNTDNLKMIPLPSIDELFSPMIYVIPVQLLAYHVAVIKGTNIDNPRYKESTARMD